jgi:hypothetical protein
VIEWGSGVVTKMGDGSYETERRNAAQGCVRQKGTIGKVASAAEDHEHYGSCRRDMMRGRELG